MSVNPVELYLTCGSWHEAQRVVDHLLEQKLIACAEFLPVKSKFAWHGGWDEAEEIKLIMHSAAHLFETVESEIAKLHTYETFVLLAVPVEHISKAAAKWLEDVVSVPIV